MGGPKRKSIHHSLLNSFAIANATNRRTFNPRMKAMKSGERFQLSVVHAYRKIHLHRIARSFKRTNRVIREMKMMSGSFELSSHILE